MTGERTYSDEEVARILDEATEVGTGGSAGAPGGLTLSELQEIGDEVGIPRGRITRAAAALDRPHVDAIAHRSLLGATTGVGRSANLPRRLTEREWNRLVVDLRETFDAKGKIRQEGAFRQWTNGNLQALLEPTETGERLRLKTVKGQAYASAGMAAAFLAMGSIAFLSSGTVRELIMAGILTFGGLAAHAFIRAGLPRWARTRREQMEGVIGRVLASVEAEDIEE